MPSELRIPLATDFRFVHEPIGTTAGASSRRMVGREDDLRDLAARILLSDGGAFLIAGYRGVGKSSFVHQVVGQVRGQVEEAIEPIERTEVADVYLNFARPLSALELMFLVIRNLRHRLQDIGVLDRLPIELQNDIETAYIRTSLRVVSKQTATTEGSFEVGTFPFKLPLVSGSSPLKIGMKRSSAHAKDLEYLAYDDKSAEYDLVRLARREVIS